MAAGRSLIRLAAPLAAAAVLAAAPVLGAGQAWAAPAVDLHERAAGWDAAAARLGTAGSLWEPIQTGGLSARAGISVLADRITVDAGVITGGDTFAGVRYGTAARGFTISERWSGTGWAAQPAYSSSMARVGRVTVLLGPPGTQVPVRATVYANCFPQAADGPLAEVPRGFRCTKADVRRTGGVLRMTARPASTMSAPGKTAIVIQSTGLSHAALLRIASSLQQVAGAAADGAGSGQMLGMCRQMVDGSMSAQRASAFARANGYLTRVGSIDGVPQAVTTDYRPDRFTLDVQGGRVVSCAYG